MLLEKGISYEFVNAPPWDENSPVPQYNPLVKIPALVTDSGKVWFNSSIIASWRETQGKTPGISASGCAGGATGAAGAGSAGS